MELARQHPAHSVLVPAPLSPTRLLRKVHLCSESLWYGRAYRLRTRYEQSGTDAGYGATRRSQTTPFSYAYATSYGAAPVETPTSLRPATPCPVLTQRVTLPVSANPDPLTRTG
eukprot:1242459-Rhodomonas_salina.3